MFPRTEATFFFYNCLMNRFLNATREGNNQFLFYIATVLIVAGAYLAGQLPLTAALIIDGISKGLELDYITANAARPSALGFNTTLYLALIILTFATALAALFFCVKFFHKRPALSLITGTDSRRLNFSKIFYACSIWFIILFVSDLILYFKDPGNYTLNFDASRFLVLLPVVLFMLPIQTSMEEVFFRGYLLQGLASGKRRVAAAIIISSLLFALMHSWNPEVETHGFFVMFPFYFSFGLFLAVIAVLDESLEIPLAVHAANNMYGALMVTFPESALQTDAIWTIKKMDPVESYPYLYAGILLFGILMYVRYRWNNFHDLLA